MRVNALVALKTGISRRQADRLIQDRKIQINDQIAEIGHDYPLDSQVKLANHPITDLSLSRTVMLNKPINYVVSRNGQGALTVYDLLPQNFSNLKAAGRLDKDSEGLLILSNDGQLLQNLTHPKYLKVKIYEVTLNKSLDLSDFQKINNGIKLPDGISNMKVSFIHLDQRTSVKVKMHEGRNRQIRRTFNSLNYQVTQLRRIQFGPYKLNALKIGEWQEINKLNQK